MKEVSTMHLILHLAIYPKRVSLPWFPTGLTDFIPRSTLFQKKLLYAIFVIIDIIIKKNILYQVDKVNLAMFGSKSIPQERLPRAI